MNDPAITAFSSTRDQHRLLQPVEYSAILDCVGEGVLVLDDQQRICSCNRMASQLLHLDGRDIVGASFSEINRYPQLEQLFHEHRAGKATRGRNRIQITGDGYTHLLEVRMYALEALTAQPRRDVICLVDSTADAQSVRMKSDFVANASHELRTPVSTMKAACETLLQGSGDWSIQEKRFLDVLAKNVERLEELVRDLLDLNWVEAPTIPLNRKKFRPRLLMEDVLRNYQDRIEQKGICVNTAIECESFWADRKLLKLVFMNLFDNAVKFVPEQGGQIDIRFRMSGQRVHIEIQDNGCGIPREEHERIFERFYQIDKARCETDPTGTGLGLAIVKHAITAMSGTLKLDSELGKGTLIHLEFPSV